MLTKFSNDARRARAVVAAVTLAPLAGASPAAAEVGLNLYGDTDYLVTRDQAAAGAPTTTTNAFSAPRLELFLTAEQGKLAVLAETMFEVGDDNTFKVDIERIEIGYLFNESLRLRAGRFHTAVGYYNDAYHHGRYFQTTVDRPAMVRFEDEGGLLPAHSVGLHVDGRFALGNAGSLRYDADLANGRGRTPGEVTNLDDPNNDKLFNLRLRIEPRFLDGLILGANVLTDRITSLSDAADPTGPTVSIREWMLGGHVVYLENSFHVIGEYLWVSHRWNDVAGANHRGFTQGAFLELGYDLGRATPYLRGELVHFPADIDPFYAANALFLFRGSSKAGIAGVKITASDYIAFKLENELVRRDAGGYVEMVAAQCAFAF